MRASGFLLKFIDLCFLNLFEIVHLMDLCLRKTTRNSQEKRNKKM